MNDLRYEENEFLYSYEYIITAQGNSLLVFTRGGYRTLFGLCTKSKPAGLSQVEKKKGSLFFIVSCTRLKQSCCCASAVMDEAEHGFSNALMSLTPK